MEFEFKILRSRFSQIELEVDPICNFGHQRLAKSKGPVVVVIFGNESDRVAAGIGGVVICAVVINCPIHKLKTAVAAYVVQIKKICHAELAATEFDPARGKSRRHTERPAHSLYGFAAEPDNLAKHCARQVGLSTQFRISHYVHIDE